MRAGIEAAPKTGRWTGEFLDRKVEEAYRAATAVEHARRVKLLTFIAVPVEIGLISACYYMVGGHPVFYWLVVLRLTILALAGYLVVRLRGNAKRIGKDAILVAGFAAHLGTLWIIADQMPRLSPETFQLQFNLAVFALSSLLFFSWRARLLTTLAIAAAIVPIYAIAIPAVTGRGLASHAADLMVIILFIGTAYISARALEMADRQRYLALLEHQKREAQANELANARRELIELVSHNYRQPLHALAFYIEAAARLGAADQDAQSRSQFAEVIGKQRQVVGALSGDLQRLLDYIKLDSGFVRPEPREFPLDAIGRHVEQVHGARAEAAGVWVRYRNRQHIHAVQDFTLICTMLDALVNNAVAYRDASKAKCRVLVAARRRGDRLRIEVIDNGIGIAQEDLARIGRAYFRGATASEATTGTGLGLAIVYRLADVLGGTCTIRSRLGRGTLVRLSLPTGAASQNTLRSGLEAESDAPHARLHDDSDRPAWA